MTRFLTISKDFDLKAVLLNGTALLSIGLVFSFVILASGVSAQQHEQLVIVEGKTRQYFSEPHLGTIVQLAFYLDDREVSQQLSKKCFERVSEFNQTFSDYLPDSEVSQLCAKPSNVAHKVSKDLFTVIAQAQQISTATNGAFDITLGVETQRWRESARLKKILPADPKAEGNKVNYKHLVLDSKLKTITLLKPLKIDLGGIAKGYIADQLMLILRGAGIKQAAVVIGGEMVFSGAPPNKKGWKVTIEGPNYKNLGTLTLINTALSTSGDSYQFFEADGVRHAHVIDPLSGKAKTNRLNVTTIACSAMLADAWATSLRVMPTEKAIKFAKAETAIEAAFIPHKKQPTFTAGFPKVEKLKSP